MSVHTSVHSLAAAQAREVLDARARRRQTWAAVAAALLLGAAAGVLLTRRD